MILYLDTSALVKLYAVEHGSQSVRRLVAATEHVATSVIALPDAAAALARRRRSGHLDAREASRLLQRLQTHWPRILRLHVDPARAAHLAWERDLRGMDAVHLAAACTLRDRAGSANVVFCAFDTELTRAAVQEGLAVLPAPAGL